MTVALAWSLPAVAGLAAAVLCWSAPAPAGASSVPSDSPGKVRVLDVPYVPQGEALCGGAALAMVLRYWGRPGVLAEDFAALVEPGQGGIRTGVLVEAVEALGWSALPLPGDPAEVRRQLAQGRPVIALISSGPGALHYVVLVAWANGWVIEHDPNVAPFRTVRAEAFEASWAASGEWALLVLPARDPGTPPVPDSLAADPFQPARVAAADSIPAADHRLKLAQAAPAASALAPPADPPGCRALVDAGVLLAQEGDSAEAELRFRAAESLFPASASPVRERAGLRFRAAVWAGAARLAERALALDPADEDSWRLLAGCRFLDGDVEGALAAWNRLAEPRTDLAHVDGLARVRFSTVARQLDLPPGCLLTPRGYRLARRRLAELPAQSDFRLSLRPLAGGLAQVNVTVLERPLLFTDAWDVGRVAAKAVLGRELTLDVASPTGNGELWTAGWRWWPERPRVAIGLVVPAARGRTGIWRVEGSWERQAYAAHHRVGESGGAPDALTREERRRTSLSGSDWFGPDLWLEAGMALDEWVGRGAYLSLGAEVETRWARDRWRLRGETARWASLRKDAGFGTGALSLAWNSRGAAAEPAWQGCLGLIHATSGSPLALWSGAGTGSGRDPLLRAHPLLREGVVWSRVFGRTLTHGTIERQAWPWTVGPMRLGWALFLDGALSGHTGDVGHAPWQVDSGVGLRLRGLGLAGQVRIDAARGLRDGHSAVSAAWQVP